MRLVKARVSGTGHPIDGHVLALLLEKDNDKKYYLIGAFAGDTAADAAVMRTVHKTDTAFMNLPEDKFAEVWKNGEYEPDGAFAISAEHVEVLEEM